ncbi:hypothetical protein EsDP_00005538 [Epichloe bromicola]|uniref:Uncharacterized protein n=1 Tax=Epichloe bromicola TaxID=79588 RepID=A0ABQ0CUZ4_9HYPO
MITATLTTIAEFGVLPDDIKLDNFHLVGDKVMAVDLETVSKVTSKECVATEVASVRDILARHNLGCYISQRHGTEDIKDRNLTSHVLQGAVPNLDRLERINCDENKT